FNDGQYILKVGLLYEPKIWRKVALNGEDTLLDLHQIIQKAFKFDDDHLYAFYMDKRRNRSINDPRGGDPPFVDDFQLGDLNLTINQRFFYLFDFGDSWEFTIDLLEIQEVDKKLKTPKIIEKKGEAPPQYGYYDEDDDFDKWE
ncbi:MAG: plasmid pRiA4b ORF-3 family protein, partial [Bacteroidota bacterium]